MELQKYDFTIRHRAGKQNANADALSRIEPEENYEVMVIEQAEPTIQNELKPPMPLRNGSQYLYNLGPCPGESDDEPEETIEVFYLGHQEENGWGEYSEQKQGYWSEGEWDNNDYLDESWSVYSDQQDEDYVPGEITLEGINEDLTSIIYGRYTQEEYDNNFRAYTPNLVEFAQMYMENLMLKNVVAGQPINRGGSRCTGACDIENHHTHTYCKACKRNFPYGTIVHDCIIGFETGKIRPGMDPKYLINQPWWKDPTAVEVLNNYHHLRFLYRQLLGLPFYATSEDFSYPDSVPEIVDLD
jgi:hypothetical protein